MRRWHRRASRRIGQHVARAVRTPFGRLVQHFLIRMLRAGHSDSADLEMGVGPLLGLLAAPGLFQCCLMFDRYSKFLNWVRGRLHDDLLGTSAPDKYIFIALAMGVAGIVTVLKWDRTLPDSQDYLNLAPLPLSPRRILLANIAAIAIAAATLSLTVNGIPSLFFPMVVVSSGDGTIALAPFVGAHLLCVTLASLFAFCSVFAILGTCAAMLGRELFRAVAPWLRGALFVAFVAILLTAFAGPELLTSMHRVPDSPLRLLPPMWFLSLYQSIHHRATPVMMTLIPLVWWACGSSFVLMTVTYGLTYRRRFVGVLEGSRAPTAQRATAIALAVLDLFAPRAASFSRACYLFTVRALLRNDAQRFWISTSLALGGLLAFSASLFEGPLIVVFPLMLGLRLAFEAPATVPANWVFRSALNEREIESIGVARRVMIAFGTVLVCGSSVVVAWERGVIVAGLHALYLVALSWCLIEALLYGYRRIPFTCSVAAFRENLPMRCFLCLLGFVAFVRGGASIEVWMIASPRRLLLLPALMAGVYTWNRARVRDAREAGELEEGISFDSAAAPDIQRLKLFEG